LFIGESPPEGSNLELHLVHLGPFYFKDRMNMPTGRALAEPRHQFMEDFVAQFLAELNVAG
jgi:HD superfamily phosphodiesterase